MDNRKVAQQVIEHLGGKENITNALHCVTRLRFNVKEDAKVNGAAIEAIDGVMGMQIKNGQYQVIIGPMVADVFLEVEELLGHSGSEAPKTRMGNVLDIITGIFSAILPALVAGGMLKGILAMLEAMGMSSGGGDLDRIQCHLGCSVLFSAVPAGSFRRKKIQGQRVSGALRGRRFDVSHLCGCGGGSRKPLLFLGDHHSCVQLRKLGIPGGAGGWTAGHCIPLCGSLYSRCSQNGRCAHGVPCGNHSRHLPGAGPSGQLRWSGAGKRHRLAFLCTGTGSRLPAGLLYAAHCAVWYAPIYFSHSDLQYRYLGV